jgi:hypothetical protein
MEGGDVVFCFALLLRPGGSFAVALVCLRISFCQYCFLLHFVLLPRQVLIKDRLSTSGL